MALPVTSGYVSKTPCESCDLSFMVLLLELLYLQLVVRVLILNRCETSRFEPLNPGKCPTVLTSHTNPQEIKNNRTTDTPIIFNSNKDN